MTAMAASAASEAGAPIACTEPAAEADTAAACTEAEPAAVPAAAPRPEKAKKEENKGEQAFMTFLMVLSSVLGVALAIVLFMWLPAFLFNLLVGAVPALDHNVYRGIFEGVFRIALFIGYMLLVSMMKDIRRVFMYHGAEHKTIFCYESGEELTVENVRRQRRFHPRCGTSFLLIVILISILAGALITTENTLLRIALKLLLLPVVMSVSYEIIKLCGRYDNPLTRAVSAPGLWLQRITTSEPDDGMIECAIAAVLPVLPENPEDGKW